MSIVLKEKTVRAVADACDRWIWAQDSTVRAEADVQLCAAVEAGHAEIAYDFSRFMLNAYARRAFQAAEFSRYVVGIYGSRQLNS
jgi:hypothetical protein